MALDREAIFTAMMTKLGTVPGVVSVSRRLKNASDIPATQQPCLFLVVGKAVGQQVKGLPIKWLLDPGVLLYAKVDDPSTSPGSVMDPIIKDIETAFEWKVGDSYPAAGSPGTLGGLCTYCALKEVQVEEGSLDGQGVALLQFEILVTA